MSQVYSSDNSGNRTPNHPNCVNPVPASGITLSTGDTGSDVQETGLIGGQMYAIILQETDGYAILASTTGATSTAANIEWVFPSNLLCIFRMPVNKTVLYFEGTGGNMTAYMMKVAE